MLNLSRDFSAAQVIFGMQINKFIRKEKPNSLCNIVLGVTDSYFRLKSSIFGTEGNFIVFLTPLNRIIQLIKFISEFYLPGDILSFNIENSN